MDIESVLFSGVLLLLAVVILYAVYKFWKEGQK